MKNFKIFVQCVAILVISRYYEEIYLVGMKQLIKSG